MGPCTLNCLRSPWLVVAVGVWVQCFTGGMYDFSIYSQSIKESLGLSQASLDSISVAKDIGANVGIISGLMYDHLPTWIVLACAAVLSLVGNLSMWLSITYRVPSPPLILACLYAFLAANSQTFSNTAVVVTCVKIFPNSRGTVVGLMKGSLGIGGAVLIQAYYALLPNEDSTFPLLMACISPSLCIFAMFVIRIVPQVENGDQQKWLSLISMILSTLALYLLVVILVQSSVNLSRLWRIVIFGGIIIILVSPLWVVLNTEAGSGAVIRNENTGEYILVAEGDLQSEINVDESHNPLLVSSKQEASSSETRPYSGCESFDPSSLLTFKERVTEGVDVSFLQAILSLNFWLLFFTTACGMGSGLTTINNMSQIGLSLGYTSSQISTFVSLWSIWNFFGRLGGGYISELYLQTRSIPRPFFIMITLGAMVSGHIIIALAFPGALYIGPILVGTCYGAQWSLMPATASELFGLKNFGAIFNTIAIASPLSSYILSVKVTGYLYDQEAEKSVHGWLSGTLDNESSSCSGACCFRLSFLIMSGVCLAGSCVALILFFRTRKLYRYKTATC